MLCKAILYLVFAFSWFDCAVESSTPACYQRTHVACVASGYNANEECTPAEYSEGLADESKLGIELSTEENAYIVDWAFYDIYECSRGGDCVFGQIPSSSILFGCTEYYLWDDYEELPEQYANLDCTAANLGFDPEELGY